MEPFQGLRDHGVVITAQEAPAGWIQARPAMAAMDGAGLLWVDGFGHLRTFLRI